MLYKYFWLFRTMFLRLRFKRIGLLSYVAKPVFIYGAKGVTIGNKVRIFPGLRIETHHGGTIVFEDNISIGQNFHVISSGELLTIGGDTTISGNVFITNMDHDYTEIGVHILRQKYITKTTSVGKNCFIGYGAVLQAGTVLGDQCIVGANSVVRGQFPAYCVIAGAPAKIVKQYNPETKTWGEPL